MTLPRGTFDLRTKNRILKSNQRHIATIIEASPSRYTVQCTEYVSLRTRPSKNLTGQWLDEHGRVQMDFQLALLEWCLISCHILFCWQSCEQINTTPLQLSKSAFPIGFAWVTSHKLSHFGKVANTKVKMQHFCKCLAQQNNDSLSKHINS